MLVIIKILTNKYFETTPTVKYKIMMHTLVIIKRLTKNYFKVHPQTYTVYLVRYFNFQKASTFLTYLTSPTSTVYPIYHRMVLKNLDAV